MENVSEYEYSGVNKTPAKRKPVKPRSFRAFISGFLTLLLTAAIVLMLIKTLFIRIELTRQNDINVSLERELSELKEENRRLSIRYESLIDLTELEDYAKNELGMKKPDISQIKKIDTETQDKSIILSETAETGKAGKIGDLISIISEALL